MDMKIIFRHILSGCVACMTVLSIVFVMKPEKALAAAVTVNVNTADVTDAIQDALDEARVKGTASSPCTVTIPSGTYILEDTLKIYSNTTLEMTGVTLNRGEGVTVMLRTGRKAEADAPDANGLKGGYSDFENITLHGGIWDGKYEGNTGIIRMCHGKNIKLDGVTVRNNFNSHHMEFAAIDGLSVQNCTIYGHKETSGSETNKEALQLDIMQKDHLSGFYLYDETPMKNVLIQNNNFHDVFRGVGTHSVIMGKYMDHIKIINNKFSNIEGAAIAASGYRNCTITGNTMQNVGIGVLFRILTDSGKQVYEGLTSINTNCQSVISDNSISIVKTAKAAAPVGIELDGFQCTQKTGVIPAGNYYVGNVKVRNNKIVSAGIGIKLDNVRSSVIEGNVISPSDTKMSRRNGITVTNCCSGNTIKGNQISNVTQSGIALDKSSNNTIIENKISAPTECGIKLFANSKNNKINSNRILSAQQRGIYVTGGSSATEICSNVVNGSKENGIYLRENATAKSIKNNSVSKSGKHGIALYVKSKASNIIGNKVTGSKSYGICVDTGCTAKIYPNTFSSNKDGQILIRSGKNYKCNNINTLKIPSASSPNPKTLKVSWKRASDITGYEIQLSVKKDFSSGNKTVNVTSAKTTKQTITRLSKKKTYYVRIRSYRTIGKTVVYSSYSKSKKVPVK